MMSTGRLFALDTGRRALLRIPVTLELGLMVACESDTVRRDGTLRGGSSGRRPGTESEFELGGSSGVLASDDSSTDPGEPGWLSP